MACMLASFSEGLTLADRSGLSKQDLIQILSLGAMQNPMFNMKGPKIVVDGASAGRGNISCLRLSVHLLTPTHHAHNPWQITRPTSRSSTPRRTWPSASPSLASWGSRPRRRRLPTVSSVIDGCLTYVHWTCRIADSDRIDRALLSFTPSAQRSTRRRWRLATASWTSRPLPGRSRRPPNRSDAAFSTSWGCILNTRDSS